MSRRRRAKGRGGMWGLIAIVALCFIGGGAAAWIFSGDSTSAAVKGMSRSELEREVTRLRAQVDEKDRRIADLMIELKLKEAGSAAGGP